MRLRKVIAIILICIIQTGFYATKSVAADPLPIQLVVDISAIANIEDLPMADDLGTEIKNVLSEHIFDTLNANWYVTDSISNVKLMLRISQSSPRRHLRFRLNIEGDIDESVSFRGLKIDTLPVNGAAFKEDIIDAVYEFLIEKEGAIQGTSQLVYNETNDALKTVVRLNRPLVDDDRLRYRSEKLDVYWDRLARFMTFESGDKGTFEIPILLRPGETRKGFLKPQIYQSLLTGDDLPKSQFCFTRPMIADPIEPLTPTLNLFCPIEGQCTLREATPADWAYDDCAEVKTQNETPDVPWLWGAAHAATIKVPSWNVPSLDVLYERAEAEPGRFVGFTEFVIRADDLQNLMADSYTATIIANGVVIKLNGVGAEESHRRFEAERGLIFRFGLENLQFAGRENGCEDIQVEFKFFEQGTPTGQVLMLQRGYAALRHPPVRVSETAYGIFEWKGEYITTSERNESAIFLSSALFAVQDQAQEKIALAKMNQIRRDIDAFGWTLSARELGLGLGLESVLNGQAELRIVGKLRPPRTINQNGEAAYGVLVGVEEPSGQLQFSFDAQQREALKKFLLTRRAESAAARAIIPEDLYIYSYSSARRTGPEWVCNK
jgi:hypothetical protein